MLNRFETLAEENPNVAEQMAKTCALMQGSVPDFSRVELLSRRIVRGTENNGWYRQFVLTKALVDYRCGRFEQAVQEVQRFAPKASGSQWDASAFALLAMVHHRLDQADPARASLDSARAIIANKAQDTIVRDFPIDWIHCQILCREAEALLGAKDPKSPPPTSQPHS